ncbi:MAG: hypothetical protein U9P38_03305, partial [Campylobacterota bacterium]|nr:hypothetical protein [Campylobacterota bacterium]
QVRTMDEIQSAKETRLLDSLGYSELSDEEKQDILVQLDEGDLENESISTIKEKITVEGVDFVSDENSNKDDIYSLLGLDKLDSETQEILNTKFEDVGFDFETATSMSVKDQINEDGFLGDDIEFNQKILDAMSGNEVTDIIG